MSNIKIFSRRFPGDRIKLERQRLKKTQQEIADICGVSRETWSRYEAGKLEMGKDVYKKFIDANADADFLVTGIAKDVYEAMISKNKIKTASLDDFVMVARHEIAAAAGHGGVVTDESIVDHLAFKREWIKQTLGLDPAHLALIDARGDSMSPTIESGDLLLLDTRPEKAKHEGVYVINLNGALLVKRLRIRLTGVIEVLSDNAQYGKESISGAQMEQLIIVGRVVWHGRKF